MQFYSPAAPGRMNEPLPPAFRLVLNYSSAGWLALLRSGAKSNFFKIKLHQMFKIQIKLVN